MKPVLRENLRYPRLWFTAGLLIAGLIAAVSLVPSDDLPDIGVSDKVEHALAHLLLAFWFASVIIRRNYFMLMLALLAFGGAIELAQQGMEIGRQAEWLDLFADAAGAAAGVLLAMTPLGLWAQWVEQLLWGSRTA